MQAEYVVLFLHYHASRQEQLVKQLFFHYFTAVSDLSCTSISLKCIDCDKNDNARSYSEIFLALSFIECWIRYFIAFDNRMMTQLE